MNKLTYDHSRDFEKRALLNKPVMPSAIGYPPSLVCVFTGMTGLVVR